MSTPLISLTTDFGLRDGFVGVMKGVILGICPEVHLVDLSHDIRPQNIREGAFILDRQVWYFPPNSIHVIVVDPGVGTVRRPIAAQIGDQYFVAPDNGVLTPLLLTADERGWTTEFVHTNNPNYWLSNISHVFHGRDIFAPVGAHLAAGVPLKNLGEAITNPVQIRWPQPDQTETGWVGEVLHIDHFGNLLTNIRAKNIGERQVRQVQVGSSEITNWVHAFGERSAESLVALISSHGYLVIAEVNGNAAARVGAGIGDQVEVIFD